MTQDEVIDMARFAGITIDNFGFQGGFIEEFVVFSKLVAAKEREACAKVIESHGETLANGAMLADAIRARGEQA
jgi:hypothetical protein